MPKKKKKILSVEDNELNRKILQSLLSVKGFEVIDIHENFENAVTIAKKEKPDLILMDIQLVGYSGLDIIKEVKSDSTLKSTPVIAVTALAMDSDRESCFKAGCDDYISKPYRIEDVMQVIDKWVGVKV